MIAVAVVGVGATVVHVVDILEEGNLAAGNSIQNVANLLKPALLIPLLIVSRRAEPAGEMLPPRSIGGGCRLSEPLITAVVGTGFALGFWLELTVPATLVAAVLAAGMAVRSAGISSSRGAPSN